MKKRKHPSPSRSRSPSPARNASDDSDSDATNHGSGCVCVSCCYSHPTSCDCPGCQVHRRSSQQSTRRQKGKTRQPCLSALHSPIPSLSDSSSQDTDQEDVAWNKLATRAATTEISPEGAPTHPLLHVHRALPTVQVAAYGGPLLQREMYWDEFTSLAPIDQLKSMLAARTTLLNSLMDHRPPPFGLLLPPSGENYSSDRELQKALKRGQRFWMFKHSIRDMSCWTDYDEAMGNWELALGLLGQFALSQEVKIGLGAHATRYRNVAGSTPATFTHWIGFVQRWMYDAFNIAKTGSTTPDLRTWRSNQWHGDCSFMTSLSIPFSTSAAKEKKRKQRKRRQSTDSSSDSSSDEDTESSTRRKSKSPVRRKSTSPARKTNSPQPRSKTSPARHQRQQAGRSRSPQRSRQPVWTQAYKAFVNSLPRGTCRNANTRAGCHASKCPRCTAPRATRCVACSSSRCKGVHSKFCAERIAFARKAISAGCNPTTLAPLTRDDLVVGDAATWNDNSSPEGVAKTSALLDAQVDLALLKMGGN